MILIMMVIRPRSQLFTLHSQMMMLVIIIIIMLMISVLVIFFFRMMKKIADIFFVSLKMDSWYLLFNVKQARWCFQKFSQFISCFPTTDTPTLHSSYTCAVCLPHRNLNLESFIHAQGTRQSNKNKTKKYAKEVSRNLSLVFPPLTTPFFMHLCSLPQIYLNLESKFLLHHQCNTWQLTQRTQLLQFTQQTHKCSTRTMQ